MTTTTRPADAQPFLTIAGRWRRCSEASKLGEKLDQSQQTFAMMMFMAGFSAALEATTELADFDEAQAMKILRALHQEAKSFSDVATLVAAEARSADGRKAGAS